jgi:hypothetical protein
MEYITSTTGLKRAIELLEAEQADTLQRLKEQSYTAYESLKPANLIRSTLNDISTSPFLIDNILGTALGFASGYFTKRLVVGASVNKVRKLFGLMLQFGITNVVAHHADTLKSFGRYIFQYAFTKKTKSSKS